MAIGNAVQKGIVVHVFDEKGRFLCQLAAGDGLKGYPSGTVNIQYGNVIRTFDERGKLLSSGPAR